MASYNFLDVFFGVNFILDQSWPINFLESYLFCENADIKEV